MQTLILLGHFHAVADLDKLHQEMSAAAVGSRSKLRLFNTKSNKFVDLPAAINEGKKF